MAGEEKRVSRKLLIAFVCLTLAFAVAFAVVFIHGGYMNKVLTRLGLQKKEVPINYTARGWDRCLKYMGIDSDVVFFGDSITSAGNFNSYFPDVSICNLGIPGDSLQGMIARADMIATVKPEKVFILGGINSLRDTNFSATLNEYTELLNKVDETTDAKIYVFGILPISKEKESEIGVSNKTISEFNNSISDLAGTRGYTYIDLPSLFINEIPNRSTIAACQ